MHLALRNLDRWREIVGNPYSYNSALTHVIDSIFDSVAQVLKTG